MRAKTRQEFNIQNTLLQGTAKADEFVVFRETSAPVVREI